MNRISALKKEAFNENGFDGYILFDRFNLLYFMGCPGASALLVSPKSISKVYAYGVNYEQVKAQTSGFQVELIKNESLMAKIAREVSDQQIRKLAIDTIDFEGWRSLNSTIQGDIQLQVNNGLVQLLRSVKDTEEIVNIRKASELTSLGMKVAKEVLRSGIKEHEVAAEVEYAMRKSGSGPTAFETIVASGEYSAYPHGGCSERVITSGDLVVVDLGATYNFYCSDMTRTFVVGTPSEKQEKIFGIVKKAQDVAVELSRIGKQAAAVDQAARNIITREGFGDFFVHRLGHGVGLEVHEAPALSQNGKETLKARNVVTVEPGIYLPDWGGVRIEDTILINEMGSEKLTSGSYSLK